MKQSVGKGSLGTLKKLMRYLKHYWFFLIASIVMSFISVALTLYIPILTGNAVDFILEPGKVDFPAILRILITMGGCIGITALAQWIMNICNNKMTYNIVRDVRRDAFDRMEQLPLKYLDSHTSGEIVSRIIADVDQFAELSVSVVLYQNPGVKILFMFSVLIIASVLCINTPNTNTSVSSPHPSVTY